jgi:hypothetical protein
VDNTLKVLLGVLGFAGVLTVLATTLNIQGTPETPATAAVIAPAAPLPVVADSIANPDAAEVVDEEDVTDEEINSFGEPSIELPNEPEEDQSVSEVGPTPPYNEPAVVDEGSASAAEPAGQ